MPMAMTPYGGWHREDKDSAESWTRRTTHTGDNVGYYEFDQRFEHPGRTWASATHRAFSFACVGAAMANETWKFVQAKSRQAAGDEAGTRYQRRGCAHEGDAATGGGTPCARGRHAMEPERRRHQFQPLRALRARASRQAGPRNTTQESSKFFIFSNASDALRAARAGGRH